MPSPLLQVFEYEKLRFSENPIFTKTHFDALVAFNEKNKNKYYQVIHNGVQFGSYVGVIQVGGLTIEILPKADKSHSNSESQKKLWQSVLLNMLRVCKHIQVDNISETQLKKRYNSILDIYYEMFLAELEELVHSGLIKKYQRIQSNQNALKGKLVFSKNIQQNVVHKERFYCEHQVYDRDHLIHQILFKSLSILKDIAPVYLSDRIQRLDYIFNGFKSIQVSKSSFEKISLDRKSIAYHKALDIAKMIILNYSPSIQAGRDNMLTLLFDMNTLWEEFIYRVLSKYAGSEFDVYGQDSKAFWQRKRIKPDIVIKYSSETYIIDTKWKIIEENKPSDDDLKQMFTYNLYWESEKSMLLYPRTNQYDSDFGDYHFKALSTNQCKLGFIDLVDGDKKIDNQFIAQQVLDKFF
jgi:5-methylcytosine-specific restriction enzyme subunit McrC